MRKILAIGFALATSVLTLPAHAALKVFACEPEWAALTTVLGGSDVDVYAASTALQDVHHIQPRPSLIARYRQADLVVCTGAELEIGWLPPLVQKGDNPKVNPGTPGYFEASHFVTMMEVPARLDRSEGDVHPFGNPHIQTDPRNIGAVAKGLAERLAEVDPAHAAAYRQRYQAFIARWDTAIQKWTRAARPLAGVKVISSHKGWSYMYRWLGMEEVGTLEPKPGIPPTGAHLEEVLAAQKTDPARMVIYAGYYDPRPAGWLSSHAGIPAVELPFSTGGMPGTDDLFGLFDVTISQLLKGLKQAPSP
ncbi:MAG: metal ABC transporter substrate-binding protein [Stenotrophobium sp.]